VPGISDRIKQKHREVKRMGRMKGLVFGVAGAIMSLGKTEVKEQKRGGLLKNGLAWGKAGDVRKKKSWDNSFNCTLKKRLRGSARR